MAQARATLGRTGSGDERGFEKIGFEPEYKAKGQERCEGEREEAGERLQKGEGAKALIGCKPRGPIWQRGHSPELDQRRGGIEESLYHWRRSKGGNQSEVPGRAQVQGGNHGIREQEHPFEPMMSV